MHKPHINHISTNLPRSQWNPNGKQSQAGEESSYGLVSRLLQKASGRRAVASSAMVPIEAGDLNGSIYISKAAKNGCLKMFEDVWRCLKMLICCTQQPNICLNPAVYIYIYIYVAHLQLRRWQRISTWLRGWCIAVTSWTIATGFVPSVSRLALSKPTCQVSLQIS